MGVRGALRSIWVAGLLGVGAAGAVVVPAGATPTGRPAAVRPAEAPVGGLSWTCTQYRHAITSAQNSALEKQLVTAQESGGWSKVKRLLLRTEHLDSAEYSTYLTYMSGAPASVRRAGDSVYAVTVKFLKDVDSSSSLAQFESMSLSLSKSPKFVNALKVVDAYFTARCPLRAAAGAG